MATWQYDETIRARAVEFITAQKLTHKDFTAKLAGNYSPTRVTKYLNLNKRDNKPEPDAARVEAAIKNLLRHIDRSNQQKSSLYENSVTIDVAAILRQIRRVGDFGVICSDAGEGKTSAAILFCRDNPDSIFITARTPFATNDWEILSMVFEEYQDGVADKWATSLGIKKWHWLERGLRGTQRLLIVDDAELLQLSAYRMLFSLHESTGIAVVLIGNNEIITKIRAADTSGKMISRIGIVHIARMKGDESDSAQKLINQFAPDSGVELLDAVTETIIRFGHSRRARKQLTLAANLREGSEDKSWLNNYINAGSKLIEGAAPVMSRK